MKDQMHFSPSDTRAMFRAAKPSERGSLALAIFAGIRLGTLEHLPVDCVDSSRHCIAIASKVHWGAEHIIETDSLVYLDAHLLPTNPFSTMWSWLEEYPHQPQPWAPIHKRLSRHLGFWIKDGCRKTAFSMGMAMFGPLSTAMVLGSEVLINHPPLRSYCTLDEAQEFYSLTRENVMSP